jgi:hypothetical protein
MLLSVPVGEAPLAEVSPAPLGVPAPVAPGAMVSAFAEPDDVDAFGVPAPCAKATVDADAAAHRISRCTMIFSLIKFPSVKIVSIGCVMYLGVQLIYV